MEDKLDDKVYSINEHSDFGNGSTSDFTFGRTGWSKKKELPLTGNKHFKFEEPDADIYAKEFKERERNFKSNDSFK